MMHIFLCVVKCSYILLCWIQISLQIIKRFEKEKDSLIPIWQWAKTQLEAEPGPASRFFSPPIFPFLHGPTPAQQHHSRRGPAAMIRETLEQSSWRTHNRTRFAPFSISIQLMRDQVWLEIESLELFLIYDPVWEAP
jgi:hypothetical protein